jgi:glycosyltransferase involved in cell wall biosynthesis
MDPAPPSTPVEFSMAILCYRAGESIVPFVENLHRIMSMFRIEWELVLVANYWPGTGDRTPDVCTALAARLPHVRCIAEPKQGAMGWDMRKGLEACRGRYIGVIDGDGQFPVEAIFSCFAKIRSEGYDFIKTYRVKRADGLWRNFISWIYQRIFNLLFPAYRGFHDVNSKPKIMTRAAFERMELLSDDWFIDAEIMLNCLALRLRMYEIPVKFQSLGGRKSFVKPGAVFEFLDHLLRYRFGPRHRRHQSRA